MISPTKLELIQEIFKSVFTSKMQRSIFYDEKKTEERETSKTAAGSSNGVQKQKKSSSKFYDTGGSEEGTSAKTAKSTFYSVPEEVKDELKSQFTTTTILDSLPVTVLWAESEAVVKSGILETMPTHEVALQESKFEIITSELRYLNSLNVLQTVFYESTQIPMFCTKDDWQSMFGHIARVKEASELLINDLLLNWEKDIMLRGIYPILKKHAVSGMKVYVEYCRNLPKALFTLQFSMENSESFARQVKRLEEEKGNTLMSFLSHPMQRVTRIPLLLEAVLAKLDVTTAEYQSCRLTKSLFNELALECNGVVTSNTVSCQNIPKNNLKRSKSWVFNWKFKNS